METGPSHPAPRISLGMTPIRSSDHAEYRHHCSHFGAAAECSAWTIQGFAPERRPRLGDAHAELRVSHIISLRERVSIRETLSPLDEPSIFREKRKGEGDREGPPAAMRRTLRPPPWGDGAIAYPGGPGSRTRHRSRRRGVSPTGGIRVAWVARMGYNQGHERRKALARQEPEAAAADGHRRLRLALLHLPHDDQP